MEAILFALVTYFTWCFGDLVGVIVVRRIGGFSNAFWMFCIRAITYSFLTPFFISDLSRMTPHLFGANLLLGTVLIIGVVGFAVGLQKGSAPVVSAITSSYIVITVIISLFLGEKLDAAQAISIGIIIVGVVLTTLNLKGLKLSDILTDKGIPWAFLAMICWGIFFGFIKPFVSEIGWFWPSYITFCTFPFLFLFMKIQKIPLRMPNYKNSLLLVLFSVLVTSLGDFAYNFAVSKSYAAVVAPIAGSYVTLFAPLSYFLFHDKISKQQVVGIAITLIGIVSLSILSV